MRKSLAPAVFVASIALALPNSTSAETVEKQFDDFFRQQEKFAAEDKKRREEGYVLERVYNQSGQRTGEFAIGGGPDPEPIYGAPTTYNFTGRDFNEPGGGILNLRLKF